jgi:hypothetical protein
VVLESEYPELHSVHVVASPEHWAQGAVQEMQEFPDATVTNAGQLLRHWLMYK